jgi:hypothetical protein
VANPINIFAKMIASLHDENNHYHPWFYDNVEELSLKKELKWPKPFSLEAYKNALKLNDVYGEKVM